MQLTYDEIDKVLMCSIPVMLVLYTILLGALINNTIRFIYMGASLRSFQVCFFYVLVLLAIILRISWLIVTLYISCKDGYNPQA